MAMIHSREGESPFTVIDTGSHMAAYADIDYGVALIPAHWTHDAPQARCAAS
jgi:hypothetical protein